MDGLNDRTNGHVTGEQLALDGIEAATAATAHDQLAAVDKAILELAASGFVFNSDDVWIKLGAYGVTLDHPNVIGGRFMYWRKKHRIRRTDQIGRSQRPNRHGATLFFYEGFNRG